MKDYQTIERWSFIQSFRCCAFMTVERIFLKPQISFLGENKKRPSKGNPLEAHISSCFYCLGCGNFFYQYGKAYFPFTNYSDTICTCQQKLDTKLKKSGIKNESMYKIHQLF